MFKFMIFFIKKWDPIKDRWLEPSQERPKWKAKERPKDE